MQQQANCLAQIGEAIPHIGTEQFFPTLCQSFTCLDHMGHLLVFHFTPTAKPQCLYSNCNDEDIYNVEVNAYINGPYIFDPYYQASLNGIADGAYRLKDIAPDNFKKTEFFRHYYKATHINDELSYTVAVEKDKHVHISVSPVSTQKTFTASTLNFLHSLSNIITQLIKQHCQLYQDNTKPINDDSSLNQTLQQALKNFGSMLLTPREHDVLQMVLHGHSNKAAAERLEISLATVKLHRKRIYQKLDISSQSELFYLFIDALSSASEGNTSDPLQAYMNLK